MSRGCLSAKDVRTLATTLDSGVTWLLVCVLDPNHQRPKTTNSNGSSLPLWTNVTNMWPTLRTLLVGVADSWFMPALPKRLVLDRSRRKRVRRPRCSSSKWSRAKRGAWATSGEWTVTSVQDQQSFRGRRLGISPWTKLTTSKTATRQPYQERCSVMCKQSLRPCSKRRHGKRKTIERRTFGETAEEEDHISIFVLKDNRFQDYPIRAPFVFREFVVKCFGAFVQRTHGS